MFYIALDIAEDIDVWIELFSLITPHLSLVMWWIHNPVFTTSQS